METELTWSCESQWEIPTLCKVVMGCYLAPSTSECTKISEIADHFCSRIRVNVENDSSDMQWSFNLLVFQTCFSQSLPITPLGDNREKSKRERHSFPPQSDFFSAW